MPPARIAEKSLAAAHWHRPVTADAAPLQSCAAMHPLLPFLLLTVSAQPPPVFYLRTASGSVRGTLDGPPPLASLSYPRGLALNPAGGFYFTDANLLRAVSPSGLMRTFCGKAAPGFIDGDCTLGVPRFYAPQGLAMDAAAGNLYVADGTNNAVRRVAKEVVVTTLVGGGQQGLAGLVGLARGAGPWAWRGYPWQRGVWVAPRAHAQLA